ncbi:MAG: class I SAM-dependent methyltransferase, partial [Chthoniobacterales bacterium]
MSHEDACRSVAALYTETWLRHYVGSKLRRDGVFAAAYELLRDSDQPILDIGCGVGLLPFYLRERG